MNKENVLLDNGAIWKVDYDKQNAKFVGWGPDIDGDFVEPSARYEDIEDSIKGKKFYESNKNTLVRPESMDTLNDFLEKRGYTDIDEDTDDRLWTFNRMSLTIEDLKA